MAHRTFVALALGLLALAGGCTESSPGPGGANTGPQLVNFDTLATLDTASLTFCCDPNAPFPQTIGTFTLTRPLSAAVAVTPTGEMEISAPASVGYLDKDGNPTADIDLAIEIVETYTVSALACPPPTGWKLEVKVTHTEADQYAVEDVLIENTCPPAGDPPVELTCGPLPDQLWVTDGPIVNVLTTDPVLVVGTGEGACAGTVTDGLIQVLAPFSPSFYGAVFLRNVASNTQAALAYGPNGIALRGYGGGAWGFTLVDPAIAGVDRNTTDAVPTANDPDSAQAIVTRYGRDRVEILSYDPATTNFTSVVTLGLSRFPGANGKPISACRREVGGPVYVLFNSAASQLYVVNDPGDLTPAVLVATTGNDGRRVRDEGNLLFVTCHVEDTLWVVDLAAATPVVATVAVGDGPIGVDTETLPNGDTAALTTGFNDHTYTITIVHADGTIDSNTLVVPSGGLNPGSGVFLPDGRIAISSTTSNKIIVFEP